jgi:pimeloyl-ACP methyl ester carboxylesterase
VTPHYDPKMVLQFTHYPVDYDQWDSYDALDIPTLCLRGENSDLLLPETAESMRSRGPRAVVVTIPGCGHAPALNVPAQFALVERFLNGK